MTWFKRVYGAGPLHALLMTGCFAFSAYLVSRLLEVSDPGWIALWFAGAIVAHDLVLFPLYSALDRALSARRRKPPRADAVPWVNHVRVPAVMCGILLLISFPLVFRLSNSSYVAATGLDTRVYLGRFLALSGGIFAFSGVLYLGRLLVKRGLRSEVRIEPQKTAANRSE